MDMVRTTHGLEFSILVVVMFIDHAHTLRKGNDFTFLGNTHVFLTYHHRHRSSYSFAKTASAPETVTPEPGSTSRYFTTRSSITIA